MKNIYQDDSYNPNSDDIFSKSAYNDSNAANPVRPEKAFNVDFTEDVQLPSSAEAQRPVRSARQAPPPIKKTAPVVPAGHPIHQGAVPPYGAEAPYGQQPYYPQPVYYQANPNQQAYPVYAAPGQPYPVYPGQIPGYVQQAPGYPGQVPAYPQPVPGYAQQVPATPYVPQQSFTPPATVNNDPLSKEAGTRVLFQSPDFDKKDESAEGGYETLPHTYANTPSFDVSEVELPSKKRAGTPPESPFKIDEMEIGTYELGAMSVSRPAKATGVNVPSVRNQEDIPLYTTLQDEQAEEFEYDEEIEETESTEEDSTEEDSEEKEEAAQTEPPAKEKKKLSTSEKIRRLVLTVSLIAIVVSAGMLYNEYRLHKENEDAMNSISDLIITEPVTEPSTATTESTTSSENKETTTKPTTTTPTTTRYLTPSEQFELLKKENPDINFPANIQLKYAKLYAENQDFVGYLSAENTYIDFPIVKGADNDEYIEKNFFGEYTKYGCPFMSSENNIENLDMNTVIYGHHMRDGSLFATLDQYTTLEGYKEAPVITFNTLYQDFSFKVFAVMITNILPEDDNNYVFNYYWTNLNSGLNYTAYLNQLSQRSLYDTGVNVLPTDRLLTLSTCYSEFEDARLVVVARLVRPGESTAVDTDKAVENPNPRFPQAYYDEHKLTNPYKNAYKWEIS